MRVKLSDQVSPEGGGGEQCDIEHVGVNGVVVITFLRQQIEAGDQLVLGRLDIALGGRFGSRDSLIVEMQFIQIRRVPHLASQQLNLQIRIS